MDGVVGPVDADTLRNFVTGEYSRVVAAVTLVCGDSAMAEDAVQDALARAIDRDDTEPLRNLAAWVTTVACNQARSVLRRRGRERRAVLRLGPRPEPLSPAAIGEATAVHQAISRLPRRQRQAIVLRYFCDLDVVEVAEQLGIAEGTAKALLHQGRRRLAQHLGAPPGSDDAPRHPAAEQETPR